MLNAWLVYIVAAAGCLWCWWYFTAWMGRRYRRAIRAAAVAALAIPSVSHPDVGTYGPAIFNFLLDIVAIGIRPAIEGALAFFALVLCAASIAFLLPLKQEMLESEVSTEDAIDVES